MSQLAQVIEARGEELIQRWGKSVREHLAPGGESRAELEDHIPVFLRQLRATLRGESSEDRTSPEQGTSEVGRAHGAQRFRLGFELVELVREYGLLRDLLLDLIVEEGLHVSLEEIRLVTNFVATAIADAVEEHAHQQEKERSRTALQERALRDAEQQLRTRSEGERARRDALFQHAPVAIGILRGPQLVIELANPHILQLWGRTREQAVGLPLMDALPEVRGHGFDDLLRGVMATGVPHVATERPVRLARGAGGELETVYFNFVYDALRDEHGVIEGALIVATEVTEGVLARQKVEVLSQRT